MKCFRLMLFVVLLRHWREDDARTHGSFICSVVRERRFPASTFLTLRHFLQFRNSSFNKVVRLVILVVGIKFHSCVNSKRRYTRV